MQKAESTQKDRGFISSYFPHIAGSMPFLLDPLSTPKIQQIQEAIAKSIHTVFLKFIPSTDKSPAFTERSLSGEEQGRERR